MSPFTSWYCRDDYAYTPSAILPLWWNPLEMNRKHTRSGCEVLRAVVMKSTISWDITPFSPLSVNRRFGGTYCLHLHSANHLLSRWFLAHLIFSTLKMEAICSSKMSVDFQRTTRCYIPEDGSFHIFRSLWSCGF
jgi:hypothetical protein